MIEDGKAKPRVPIGPLTLYVIWHPDFIEGRDLARHLHHGLRWIDGLPSLHGSEISVYYRSAAWLPEYDIPGSSPMPLVSAPGVQDCTLCFPGFRPFAVDDADLVAIVALMDTNLMADSQWRAFLYSLAAAHDDKSKSVLLIPVECSSGYSQLHTILSKINPVRIDHWRDSGEEEVAGQLPRRCERLLRNVAQVLLRRLRRDAKEAEVLRVFLSHAKRDAQHGVGIAESLQREALSLGQVETFLDATDLGWAENWEKSLKSAAQTGVAMIAILSDNYAYRPWCRLELQLARMPRKLDTSNGGSIWVQQAVVAVDCLQREWSPVLQELSAVPMLRYRHESDLSRVIDRLLIDALQNAIHQRFAIGLTHALSKSADSKEETHILCFIPDSYSLLEWSLKLSQDRPAGSHRVIYPGHSLSPEDEMQLKRRLGHGFDLVAMDVVVDRIVTSLSDNSKPSPSCPTRVALIAGEVDEMELLALGMGVEQLQETLQKLARGLFEFNATLKTSMPVPWAISMLLPLLISLRPARPPESLDFAALAQPAADLEMLFAWHPEHSVTLEQEVRMPRNARVRRFDSQPTLTEQTRQWSAQVTVNFELVEPAAFGLIIGGGRAQGNGWAQTPIGMAALYGLADKPVFPLAIAGGAARQLAALLIDSHRPPALGAPLPNQLQRTFTEEHTEQFNAGLHKLWERYQSCLTGGQYFGLDGTTLRKIITADSARVIRRLLQQYMTTLRNG